MAFVESLGDGIVAGHVEPDVVNIDMLGIDVLVVAKPGEKGSPTHADFAAERAPPMASDRRGAALHPTACG